MKISLIIGFFIIILCVHDCFGQKSWIELLGTLTPSPKEVIWLPKLSKYNTQKGWKYVVKFRQGLPRTQKNYLKGKMTFSTEFKYDYKNRLISELSNSYTSGKLEKENYTRRYFEDSLGRVRREEFRNEKHLFWAKDSIVYNVADMPTSYSKIFHRADTSQKPAVEKFLYSYDDRRRMVREWQIDSSGDYIYDISYTYNSRGDIITKKTYTNIKMALNNKREKNTFIVTYEYKYDKYGNWIKRFISVDGSKMELEIVRKILYP